MVGKLYEVKDKFQQVIKINILLFVTNPIQPTEEPEL